MFQYLLLCSQGIDRWLRRNAVHALRVSIGLVYLWFGALKFFPALSPAEPLATRTLEILTLGFVSNAVSILFLASFESVIGLLFLTGRGGAVALPLLYAHIAGTALPFVFFPHQLFLHFPYAPTFEAQYIFKNVIMLAAALTIRESWPRRARSPVAAVSLVAALRERESRSSVA
jgi:uncharacterized membrane protein YkgB